MDGGEVDVQSQEQKNQANNDLATSQAGGVQFRPDTTFHRCELKASRVFSRCLYRPCMLLLVCVGSLGAGMGVGNGAVHTICAHPGLEAAALNPSITKVSFPPGHEIESLQ